MNCAAARRPALNAPTATGPSTNTDQRPTPIPHPIIHAFRAFMSSPNTFTAATVRPHEPSANRRFEPPATQNCQCRIDSESERPTNNTRPHPRRATTSSSAHRSIHRIHRHRSSVGLTSAVHLQNGASLPSSVWQRYPPFWQVQPLVRQRRSAWRHPPRFARDYLFTSPSLR